MNDNFEEFPKVKWDTNKSSKFMAILVLGYFGVKIFYSLFGKYSKVPLKYETYNFAAMFALGGLIYLFSNVENRWLMGRGLNVNWLFFIGYLIGLNIPLWADAIGDAVGDSEVLQIFATIVAVFVVFSMLWIGVKSSPPGEGIASYILYVLAILIVVLGLIFTRQPSKIKSITKLQDDESGKIAETGYMKTAGTKINFNMTIVGFILSLLFVYQSEDNFFAKSMSLLNGLVLGMFAGSAAYNGVDYILAETPDQKIQKDCQKYKLTITGEEYENMSSNVSTMKWVLTITVIILIVIIILFYMNQ